MRPSSSILLALLLALAPARAEPVDDEVKKHFGLGNDLYGEARYADALVEYDEAYRLSKNWRVLFNRGQCLVMLRREPEAIDALERYLADGGDQVPEARRAAVQADLEKLRARLGRVELVGAPAGHDVLVDGRLVASTPLAAPLAIGAGAHELRVRPRGSGAPFVASIDVVAGGVRSVAVVMPATPAVAPPAASSAPPREPGFHPTPAFDLSATLGLSLPTTVFLRGRLSGLPFFELGASFRIDPLWEVGGYFGVAGGQLSLSNDVAASNRIASSATYDYSMIGVRGRLHFARTARWDLWGGAEIAAWRETFRFTGAPDAKGAFAYDATSIAPSLSGGIDFPMSKRWMLGGTFRLTAARPAAGSRNDCGEVADCSGGLPGGSSGFRAFFDVAARATWFLPM